MQSKEKESDITSKRSINAIYKDAFPIGVIAWGGREVGIYVYTITSEIVVYRFADKRSNDIKKGKLCYIEGVKCFEVNQGEHIEYVCLNLMNKLKRER